MQQRLNRGVQLALLAAVLFGASTPLAKGLLASVPPQVLAGLLYLGSGLGLGVLWLWRRRTGKAGQAALTRRDLPWLVGAIGFGGFLGPLLLLIGLSHTPASAASLFLNLEGVFTALLAWMVFRENVDRRIALGMVAIVAGGALLAWQGRLEWGGLSGPLLVATACLRLTKIAGVHESPCRRDRSRRRRLDGGDLRRFGWCRNAATREHPGRRPKNPHQRRRPLQYSPSPGGRTALRHRFVAPRPAQNPPFVAAARAGRLLRAGADPAPGRGRGVGQALPGVESGPRCTRRTPGAGGPPGRPLHARDQGRWHRADIERVEGGERQRAAALGGCGGGGEWRALGAGHRQRWAGARDARQTGTCDPPDISRAHPGRGGAGVLRCARRHLAPGNGLGTRRRQERDRHRWFSLHPPRVQRARGAGRLARAGALADGKRVEARLSVPVDRAGRVRLGGGPQAGWDSNCCRRGSARAS